FLHRVIVCARDEDIAGGVGRHDGIADPARQRPQERAGAGEFLHRVVASARDKDIAGGVGRHAVGADSGRPRPQGDAGGENSSSVLLPAFATKTSPAASVATPTGPSIPLDNVRRSAPALENSSTVLLPLLATKTSPAASVARPQGVLIPP